MDISSLSTTGASGPAILPNVRITADIANNSLLIYASRDQYKIVERAIFELDRAPMQVAIDVTVAEVTLKNELAERRAVLPRQSGRTGLDRLRACEHVLAARLPGGNLVLGKNSNPHVVINALSAVTDVHVISSPALVVLDNQQATLAGRRPGADHHATGDRRHHRPNAAAREQRRRCTTPA